MAARPQNKGYGEAGASITRRSTKGFTAKSGSPSEDIDVYNSRLRQRARMLYMSAPVATSAIKTNRTNVIGVGLQLKCNINREILGMTPEQAEEWQKLTEQEWAFWANSKRACDATGLNDFYEIQQLALASWLVSGDVFGLLKHYESTTLEPYSLRVHLVEADRIATPLESGSNVVMNLTRGRDPTTKNRIFDGVEIDDNGRVVAYHIRSTYPYEQTGEETTWTRVEAYGKETGLPQIVHLMESERCDQYRGVSYLSQVIEQLLQLRRYADSELTAAVVESFFTAFIKTEADTSENPLGEMGESDTQQERVGYENDYELGPGAMNMLAPGEDVVFGDPKRPAGGFNNFIRAICEQIGAALEIPADLLLKSFNSSYSASRAALLEAWKAFKMRRVWFVNDFCKPIYEAWLDEAVARGRIIAPGFFSDPLIRSAYLGADWIGPSQGMLDPTKEITAETLAVAQGFSTREQSTKRLNGGQWESNIETIARENAKLAEANAILISPQATPGEGEQSQQTAAIVNAAIINSIKEATKNE